MISLLNKKSVFIKLLITYCIMSILASLLIGTLSYEISSRLYNQQIEQGSMALLEQYKALIETEIMMPAKKTATDLLFNDEYKDISGFFDSDIRYDGLYWYDKEIKDFMSRRLRLVRDIYLYHLDENIILSAVEGALFLDTRDNFWWALEEGEILQEGTGWSLQYYEDRILALRFRQKYPLVQTDRPKGYIVVDVNINALLELMDSLSANQEGNLLLLDQENRLIPVTGEWFAEMVNSCKYEEEQGGGQKMSWEREDYYITYSSPLENGWRLALITPVTDFYASTIYLQRMIILLTGICIAIGIVFSIVFSRKIYSPVKKIVDRIQDGAGSSFLTGNEYEFIDREILHLGESVQELKGMLDDYKPMLEYNTVSGMINRTITEEDTWKQRLEMIGIQEEQSCVTAIIIRIRPLLFTIMDDKNLMIFKIHVIGLMKGLCGQCIISEQKSDEIVAIAFAERDDVEALSQRIKKAFGSNPAGSIFIGIGSSYEDPLDFYLSYREAVRALQYAYFDSARILFCWSAFACLEKPEKDIKGEFCREFDRQIRLGNVKAVLDMVDRVEKLSESCSYEYEYMNLMLLELIRVFARYCREVHVRIETQKVEEHFLKVENLRDFLTFFREVITDAFQKRETDMDNRNEYLIQAVCDYIDAHLEEDISLGVLAEKMGISEGHLSRTFKKLRNKSVLDYMTEKRMKEAKRLLAETNLNVETIASLCGYRTFHYFGKKFRETWGCTPTRYREMTRQKREQEDYGADC